MHLYVSVSFCAFCTSTSAHTYKRVLSNCDKGKETIVQHKLHRKLQIKDTTIHEISYMQNFYNMV